MKLHPSQRFKAPPSIMNGVPLKELMGKTLIGLIGESLEPIVPNFNRKAFQKSALANIELRELNERAQQIADAMAEQLPSDFKKASGYLIKSFGPTLSATKQNGMAPFFYYPHSHLIASVGVMDFESGIKANYELTKRFTAEFSIRPFLIKNPSACLKILKKWAKDPDAHVRRLVSEGTRSRLPWGIRLPLFQKEPEQTIPLLELLKNDPELYVRRSVANHIGDIAKDNPEVAFALCNKWIEEVRSAQSMIKKNRFWIIRHAVRYPAKKGNKKALRIRLLAKEHSK